MKKQKNHKCQSCPCPDEPHFLLLLQVTHRWQKMTYQLTAAADAEADTLLDEDDGDDNDGPWTSRGWTSNNIKKK